MPVEDFVKIAKSCREAGYDHIDLTCLTGDIFTHPDAVEIIRTTKEIGFIDTGLFTNAIALHKYDIEGILSGPLDALLISFPGFSADAYRKVYGVDSYQNFEKSVTLLLETHRRINSETLIIFEPRTYLSHSEIIDCDYYRDYFSRYLSPKVLLTKPINVFDTWGGSIKKENLVGNMKIDSPPIKSLKPFRKSFLCERILSYMVLANGDVRLCGCRCDNTIETDRDPLFLANIYDYVDFKDMVDKTLQKRKNILREFHNGNLPELCKKCPFYVPFKVDNKQLREWIG
jgi:hypothetical protein